MKRTVSAHKHRLANQTDCVIIKSAKQQQQRQQQQ